MISTILLALAVLCLTACVGCYSMVLSSVRRRLAALENFVYQEESRP